MTDDIRAELHQLGLPGHDIDDIIEEAQRRAGNDAAAAHTHALLLAGQVLAEAPKPRQRYEQIVDPATGRPLRASTDEERRRARAGDPPPSEGSAFADNDPWAAAKDW